VPVRTRAARLAGVVLGISGLLVVLWAGGLVHQHRSAASEATCVVCHLARAPLAHAAATVALPTPKALAVVLLPRKDVPRQVAVLLPCPPRAPPA
jgi:hypothetical protein